MQTIILAFGSLMVLIGISILAQPGVVFNALARHSKSIYLQITAIAARFVLGVALISSAPVSRYPATLEVLGWLLIVAAVVLGLMGRSRFMRFMEWAMKLADSFGRYAGLLAMVFGGFLVYAVV